MNAKCAYDIQCTRKPEPGHANCRDHEARLLKQAFGPQEPEPQSWHDRSRKGVNRSYAMGGIAA